MAPFQCLELLRQRRLRNIQSSRGATDTAFRGDYMKCTQMLVVHAHRSSPIVFYVDQRVMLRSEANTFVTQQVP
jgi:hypothetical protein